MNTSKIKAYAPQARRDFIQAVTERANIYGIFGDQKIEPVEFQGDVALIDGRAFSKKEGELREKLVSRVKREGFQQVIEAYAYTWFNRFVALRYMELHDYLEHGFRLLSNRGNSNIPELLEHAADVEFQGLKKDKVIELRLAGNKDNELYRLLIVAQCNALYRAMPFLFDRIDSETELLLPDNLLHSKSPIQKLINDIDEDSWHDVEIIGWIYQFYISEKKEQVIGKVVKSEDIPAATQLFTPNWIVKYMVHNTMGRMWLATYLGSQLRDKMEYYIEPAEQEPEVQKQLDEITPKELTPEEIIFLDPACGSGHILVEAYDILKEIYLEQGYQTRDIPRLIIEKNIYGLDIDDRAAQLACFSVLMKAKKDDRKILERDGLKLNVMAIQEGKSDDAFHIEDFFHGDEYKNVRSVLKELLKLFENGKTFGALISIPEDIAIEIEDVKKVVDEKLSNWFSDSDVQILSKLVDQAWILSKKYDCVVTNPPYMGGKGMNSKLKAFAKDNFPASKSDLFAMFIERNLDFSMKQGFVGMITMQSWMFLSSFERFRESILNRKTILSMVHLGARAFDSIGGEVVSTTTFILENAYYPEYKGSYARLVDGNSEAEKKMELHQCIVQSNFHHASAADFNKVPGSPIAYWVSESTFDIFYKERFLGEETLAKQGLATGDNDLFARLWHEVSNHKMYLNAFSCEESAKLPYKWYPYNKGGQFRKWYGNIVYLVNWENDGFLIRQFRDSNGKLRSRPQNTQCYFQEGVTWSDVTSGFLSARYLPKGNIYDISGHSAFPVGEKVRYSIIAYMNTVFCKNLAKILNPTLHFQIGDYCNLPYPSKFIRNDVKENAKTCVNHAKSDWNSYETSWDFTSLPLLQPAHHQLTLKATYTNLRIHWRNMTLEMQRLEEENNRIFIEAYGLQDELTPDVPLNEITLTCNPHYRYGNNKKEEELETLLLTDTIKELVSYTIGCMMGRYSLDHPGLIYAHSGNIDFDTSKYKTFPADDDGIIPIMDQEWFFDDATSRFVQFLKVAWSPETLTENLKFVADSFNPKRSEAPVVTIRRYMSTSFFKDHLKTYKKRPIYWLFSSGKQRAFECLVYLHRYNESTLSRIRSAYVTPLQGNFNARIEFLQNEKDAATASAQRKLQKEIEILGKKQEELRKFDDELRHYADMKIALDLDDGVKVNYGKFGHLLAEKKAVTGT
jgi:type II restriction/modification system DNA methylase subunit YeeA